MYVSGSENPSRLPTKPPVYPFSAFVAITDPLKTQLSKWMSNDDSVKIEPINPPHELSEEMVVPSLSLPPSSPLFSSHSLSSMPLSSMPLSSPPSSVKPSCANTVAKE